MAGAVSAWGCGGLAVLMIQSRDGVARVPLSDAPQLQAGSGAVLLRVGSDRPPLLALRLEDGSFRVLSAECPHQGCTIRSAGKGLICPCHGSSFALDGKVTHGPSVTDLQSYSSRLVDDILEIDLTPGDLR